MSNNIRIFLADDDDDDCLLFRDALQIVNPAYELIIARDGVEIIETLTEKTPPPPDCLFLDINMPRKNGLDCLREIRTSDSEDISRIPIVIFSTSIDPGYIDRAQRDGANYFMRKPSSFDDLTTAIEKVIALTISGNMATPKNKFLLLPG